MVLLIVMLTLMVSLLKQSIKVSWMDIQKLRNVHAKLNSAWSGTLIYIKNSTRELIDYKNSTRVVLYKNLVIRHTHYKTQQ